MPVIEKSVLVPYSTKQMYDLVERVEDYPQFLPWCGGSKVSKRGPDAMEATVDINYRGVTQSFTTRNALKPFTHIGMRLVDGPFSDLDGGWTFTPLRDDACKVEFRLQYAFSNILLEGLVGPVFHYIASSFVDSFTRRAEALYG